ncbi:sugar transferase [Sphingomonas oligophenolica]|uniref:Polyprenyl glycosylphosphotransferase n=1 Tax=Sphingomonas oligophenolica TaxID=301154 RepID=A0A502C5Q1_9SPHN|nr:sugar transferase [Sphingomonas oligophenolica]TPG08122.1 polyprenyl glycosylphosphotransferase [Sphingomonas oligophenolica]
MELFLVKSRRSAWNRLVVQLGGCLLTAAVIPFFIRYLTIDADAVGTLEQTFVGCIGAIVVGVWLLRNVTTYPGVETGAYILPAFALSYFALLMVFVFGRIEYNRLTLSLAFAISLIWLFFVHFKSQRSQILRIGYLPLFSDTEPACSTAVEWIALAGVESDFSTLDAVATDLRIDLPEDWDRKLADLALAGVPVFHLKHLLESLTGRVELEHLSENSFGSLIPLSAYQSIKYGIDFITAVVAAAVLLPLLLIVAIIVKCSSQGSILFTQWRIGTRGEPFKVYKFRTMTASLSSESGREAAMTKLNDTRVTPVGRFLRKTRIDELPQIVNILRGEMSWIGPRPEAEVLSRWYEKEIPFYRYRHIVRPGIAGWAQVNQGHVADVDEVRSKLHYDFYYIKNFSPWIDLLIIARTVRTVLTGFGSR